MLEQTLLSYFFNSSIVVQVVIALLLIASIFSWAVIFQKWFYLGKARIALKRFERQFEKADNLGDLFLKVDKKGARNEGGAALFWNAYQAYRRVRDASSQLSLDSAQRALKATLTYEEEALSNRLPFLATVGSTSPYVGLFGTVWGIMMSFHALGSAAQVTIAMVAPGISSALIATAMGLFAAIPAVIFYNRYVTKVDQLLNRYEAFSEQLMSALQYQSIPEVKVADTAGETYA